MIGGQDSSSAAGSWTFAPVLATVDVRALALWLLMVSATLDHFSGQLGKLAVYPENVALALVGTVYAAAVVSRRTRWFWPVASLPLAGWLTASLAASVLHAPDRGHSVLLWNKLLFVVLVYLITVNLARSRPLSAIRAQILVATALCGYAVVAFASWKFTGSHWGMVRPALNVGRSWLTQGTLREPDILGSFAAAGALLCVPFAVGKVGNRGTVPRSVAGLGATVCSLAVVVSGSRTAWLTLGVCLVVAALVYFALHADQRRLRLVVPALVLVAVLGALIAVHQRHSLLPTFQPRQNGSLIQRLASFGSLNKERDVTVREEIYGNALIHWQQHSVLGWGVGAYGESFTYPWPDLAHPGWISNLPIHVLYDSGLVGLLLFTIGIGVTGWRAVVRWHHSRSALQVMLAGLLLASLALLLAFQATEATWFAYPWIFLGVLEGVLCRHQPGLTTGELRRGLGALRFGSLRSAPMETPCESR